MIIFSILQSKWFLLVLGAAMGLALPFTFEIWQNTPTTVNMIVLIINVVSIILFIYQFLNKHKESKEDEFSMV